MSNNYKRIIIIITEFSIQLKEIIIIAIRYYSVITEEKSLENRIIYLNTSTYTSTRK